MLPQPLLGIDTRKTQKLLAHHHLPWQFWVDRTKVIANGVGHTRRLKVCPTPSPSSRHGGKTRVSKMTNPYVVLGVSPRATQAEITHAYRRHLRDHHPDIRPSTPSGDADERLRQILAAYALLRDPHRRAAYDRTTEPVPTQIGPIRIPVIHDNIEEQPPLWAGPARWHPD